LVGEVLLLVCIPFAVLTIEIFKIMNISCNPLSVARLLIAAILIAQSSGLTLGNKKKSYWHLIPLLSGFLGELYLCLIILL